MYVTTLCSQCAVVVGGACEWQEVLIKSFFTLWTFQRGCGQKCLLTTLQGCKIERYVSNPACCLWCLAEVRVSMHHFECDHAEVILRLRTRTSRKNTLCVIMFQAGTWEIRAAWRAYWWYLQTGEKNLRLQCQEITIKLTVEGSELRLNVWIHSAGPELDSGSFVIHVDSFHLTEA